MKGKKIIFLFIALLLPGFIFVFLKIFGKNQFDVPPLFQTEAPVLKDGCDPVKAPYVIAPEILNGFVRTGDSLAIVFFSADSTLDAGSKKLYQQLSDMYKQDPVALAVSTSSPEGADFFNCIFAMTKPNDIALVDKNGLIRGQYESADRDEIDRLKTEITIILKKY